MREEMGRLEERLWTRLKEIGSDAERGEAFEAHFVQMDRTAHIAIVDGMLAGFAICGPREGRKPYRVFVYELHVSLGRRGIGKQLVDLCARNARKGRGGIGAKVVQLNVHKDQEKLTGNAIEIYKRMGFEIKGDASADAYLMEHEALWCMA